MLGGGAFKEVAIPLLIRAGDEKALPHLRGRQPLLGGWQLVAARLWCICSEGIQTFVRDSFCGLVNPCPACVFAEPRYLQPEQIYWRLRRFLFEYSYFFIPADSRGERADSPAIALKAEPSDRAEAALPRSGPTPCSLSLAGMISNLDDFGTLSMKTECYLHRSALLPIYLT